MKTLKYKEYEGTCEIDTDDDICHGKLLFIDDLITYEAETPKQLKQEFKAAVDDYIETCAELKRPAQKPLKGQFNVRISPVLHKEATLRALRDEVSLNEVIVKALDCYLYTDTNVNHNVRVTVDMSNEKSIEMVKGLTTDCVKWGTIRAH